MDPLLSSSNILHANGFPETTEQYGSKALVNLTEVVNVSLPSSATETNKVIHAKLPVDDSCLKTSKIVKNALHWTQRPAPLQNEINKSFNTLASEPGSDWTYNGRPSYELCGMISEAKCIHKIIQNSPERKDFYLIDVGAGDYKMGRTVASFINSQSNIPDDITLHIIGLNGERNNNYQNETIGKCKLYNLGTFKVEELEKELKDRGMLFDKKIDLIVSSYCFRHLNDPLGTFIQAFNLLRPETGLILMDAFPFKYDEEQAGTGPLTRFMRLLQDTKLPFVTTRAFSNEVCHFMMNRPDDKPCKLTMSYAGIDSYIRPADDKVFITTIFHRDTKECENTTLNYPIEGFLSGNKSLFDWLQNNNITNFAIDDWQPLSDRDNNVSVKLP